MEEAIDWYVQVPEAGFNTPPGEHKIGRCAKCGHEITMQDKLDWMRKKGAFTKYCSNCGETFGSDDIEEFMKMVEEHKCQKK